MPSVKDYNRLPLGKGEPRKRRKAREKRQERKVVGDVRPQCVDRDNYCRWYWLDESIRREIAALIGPCSGPSEWAHIRKRWSTRNMEPTERHSTAESLMLCRRHHQSDIAGFDRRVYDIEPMTENGANGRLRIVLPDGRTWEEPQ